MDNEKQTIHGFRLWFVVCGWEFRIHIQKQTSIIPHTFTGIQYRYTLNANIWDAWEKYDWLRILKGSGVGNGYIVFSVDENLFLKGERAKS